MSILQSKRFIPEIALSFSDILLEPAASNILPQQTDITSFFSPGIALKRPFITNCSHSENCVDTAISFAQMGGIAILPHSMSISKQAEMVRKVKRFQTRIVRQVITATPDMYVAEAMEYKARHGISYLPLLDPETRRVLKVIALNDDFMALEADAIIGDLGLGEDPVTIEESELDNAAAKMREQNSAYLVVLNNQHHCVGFISKEDLDNIAKFPNATIDANGSLRVAAAVGIEEEHLDRIVALIEAGVDAIVVDTVHGHNKTTTDVITYIRRQRSGHVDVIAGNVMTTDATLALVDAGVNGVKVGLDALNNMLVPGVGIPQFTALLQVAEGCAMHQIPVIANGGDGSIANIIKAFAAGATSLIVDGLLKENSDAGAVKTEIDQLETHLRSALSYTGTANLTEFSTKTRFIRVN